MVIVFTRKTKIKNLQKRDVTTKFVVYLTDNIANLKLWRFDQI